MSAGSRLDLSRATDVWAEDDMTVQQTNISSITDNRTRSTYFNQSQATPEPSPATEKFASRLTRAQYVACYISHLLAVAVVMLVCVWVSDDAMGGGGVAWTQGDAPRVFNWHPVMMVCSFGMMTVASLAFRVPWKSQVRGTNKFLHGIEWAVAGLCLIVGVLAVVKSHNDPVSGYIANLYSFHSWIGVGVLFLYTSQFFVGGISFGLDLKSMSQPTREKIVQVHRFVGPIIYNLFAVAILLGIQEKEGFIGCSYAVTEPDTFPTANLKRIPSACLIGHSLGIIVLCLALCTTFTVHDFISIPTPKQRSYRHVT